VNSGFKTPVADDVRNNPALRQGLTK